MLTLPKFIGLAREQLKLPKKMGLSYSVRDLMSLAEK
jgi:hypothetical protein